MKKIIILIVTTLTLATGAIPGAAEPQAAGMDPSVLFASNILPAEILKGPNYQVAEFVHCDGFTNTYSINSIYGWLRPESTAMLKIRINELKAIDHMEAVQRTDVFKDALKQGLKAPLRTAKGLATEPVETVKGTVTGIGRWFSNVGRSIYSKDPYQDNVLKTVLSYDAVKRKFAYAYGINPYTSYEPVQKRLSKIAQAGFAGGLTTKVAFAAVPKAAGIVLSSTSTSDGMKKLVRDNSPATLQKINKKKLLGMGVSEALAKAFLSNYNYNPQETTLLVGELDNMKGVSDRSIFIAAASLADSESVAVFMRLRAQMMSNYIAQVSPARAIIELDGVPVLKREDRVIVGLIPFDHILWTGALRQKEIVVAAFIAQRKDITGKELWIGGTIHPTARKALEARGWKVVDRADDLIAPKPAAKTG